MKKLFCLACLLVCMSMQIFAQGIDFKHLSFDDAISMAKSQNKLMFVDFYTDWCGPCKNLAKNVFTQKEVGDFFNQAFICIKQNAEKEGVAQARKYKVSAYPTLLFINGEGGVVYKHVGGADPTSLIEYAKEALNSQNNPNNLDNLKKRYDAEKNDGKFLLTYINAMEKAQEPYAQAIEQFLKVQKVMPEASSKMMEFLMKYSRTLLVGGEAERIIKENLPEYLDIATKVEVKSLKDLMYTMLRNSHKVALRTSNVALFETFLSRWKEHPEIHRTFENQTDYELELLLLKRDYKAYREQAIAFLDDLTSIPVAEIQAKDKAHYDDYCKKNPAIGAYAEIFKRSNKDLHAGINERFILKVGTRLLSFAKKSDFKRYEKWLDYAKQLKSSDLMIDNLRSNMLYRKGDKKKAISLKEQIIEKEGPQGRDAGFFKGELKKMQDGTLFGK